MGRGQEQSEQAQRQGLLYGLRRRRQLRVLPSWPRVGYDFRATLAALERVGFHPERAQKESALLIIEDGPDYDPFLLVDRPDGELELTFPGPSVVFSEMFQEQTLAIRRLSQAKDKGLGRLRLAIHTSAPAGAGAEILDSFNQLSDLSGWHLDGWRPRGPDDPGAPILGEEEVIRQRLPGAWGCGSRSLADIVSNEAQVSELMAELESSVFIMAISLDDLFSA